MLFQCRRLQLLYFRTWPLVTMLVDPAVDTAAGTKLATCNVWHLTPPPPALYQGTDCLPYSTPSCCVLLVYFLSSLALSRKCSYIVCFCLFCIGVERITQRVYGIYPDVVLSLSFLLPGCVSKYCFGCGHTPRPIGQRCADLPTNQSII